MKLLEGIKVKNTKLNSKGGEYYATTYDANIDVFTMLSRFNKEEDIIRLFELALNENADLALANLLYILDIRKGKGERRLFKTIFKNLCINNSNAAIKILPFIGKLGRYDYILEGINTPVEDSAINIIKEQLELDKTSDNPSLLAKWLPSHRTHGVNNLLAKKLVKALGMTEKEYRMTLTAIRNKLNLVEKNLTTKDYDKIDFAKVPAKAMLKYSNSYNKNMSEKFKKYKEAVAKGEGKINTTGLYSYEIIKKILMNQKCDAALYDLMWNNQKEILLNNTKNLLVVADTSGSMHCYDAIPYCTSVGLAMYIAERNKGFFKNHFITFSEKPTLQEIKGKTLLEKVRNMEEINAWNTDIDKVFELILNVALENKLKQEDLPEKILIISDMEFDRGVSSKTGTNYNGWKKAFKEAGYILPTIIFWNVAGATNGVPVTKFDKDVALVSGFSTNILDNLLDLDNYSIENIMLEKLAIYREMLK